MNSDAMKWDCYLPLESPEVQTAEKPPSLTAPCGEPVPYPPEPGNGQAPASREAVNLSTPAPLSLIVDPTQPGPHTSCQKYNQKNTNEKKSKDFFKLVRIK